MSKNTEFGKRVRRAREEKEIGLRQLSRSLEMDYSHLSRIERGERPPPDLGLVIKIAKKLDIDRFRLLELAGVPPEIIKDNLHKESRNWISGKVTDREDNITKIDAGDWTLHTVEKPEGDEVSLGLRPEDITLYLTDEGISSSSARNRIRCSVSNIEDLENYNIVTVDCGSFDLDVAITDTSLEEMDISPGKEVFATFKATAPIIKS